MYDYDLEYTYANDYADLDEYTSYLDEDYARDSNDYESLAYRHYAWYNLVHIIHGSYGYSKASSTGYTRS